LEINIFILPTPLYPARFVNVGEFFSNQSQIVQKMIVDVNYDGVSNKFSNIYYLKDGFLNILFFKMVFN